jgi:hypothetical protein
VKITLNINISIAVDGNFIPTKTIGSSLNHFFHSPTVHIRKLDQAPAPPKKKENLPALFKNYQSENNPIS